MRSLMYRSPKLYTLMLQTIHGKYLDQRYREIASIVNNRRVFDVGCGHALLGEYVGKDRYAGMDLNQKFVLYARRNGYNCTVGDIFEEEFPTADVGVAVDVLHHITPKGGEIIDKMRKSFDEVIVVEPISSFNARIPNKIIKIWDSFLGDADGINTFESRWKWQYTPEELMEYMKLLGAYKGYVLGKDVVAIFSGKHH